MWKPRLACTPIEPTFSESPITAIICRMPGRGRQFDQPRHQRLADALAAHVLAHIDAVLDGEAIGRAVAERRIIAEAEHAGRIGRDQPDAAVVDDLVETRQHLLDRGRLFLERAGAVQHVMGIDRLDVGHIGFRGVADVHPGRFPFVSAAQDSQKSGRALTTANAQLATAARTIVTIHAFGSTALPCDTVVPQTLARPRAVTVQSEYQMLIEC